jgi:hypothetical protein
MVRIAISEAAFDAIAKTLPVGSVAYEPAIDAGICGIFGSSIGGLTGLTAIGGRSRATATSSCGWPRARQCKCAVLSRQCQQIGHCLRQDPETASSRLA